VTTRSSSRSVDFRRVFVLPGHPVPFPPGPYEVVLDETALDLSWQAFVGTTTLMQASGTTRQAWTVDPAELDAALRRDRETGSPPPA